MTETFGSRLRAERTRINPKQGEFASFLGVRQSLLSEWEKDITALKAEHLAKLSAIGIDILYVVTGERSGDRLDRSESMLLDAFRSLDQIGKGTFLLLVSQMAPSGSSHLTTRRALIEEMVKAIPTEGEPMNVFDPNVGSGGALGTMHDRGTDYRRE
ncbi:MAG TPA: helix-turn-helix transcriptional regulator [Sphingobium sp.]|nr:helix-turn-helix transcriptional regulator [Sphingobium sp.]